MTNPSLKNWEEHKALHDEILGGAEERLDSMKTLLNKLEHKELAEEMESFIEYVEESVLGHAKKEEASGGMYETIAKDDPKTVEKIRRLRRDHEIIQIMVDRMKEELSHDKVDFQKLIDHSVSIILVDEIHSRDEEDILMTD